MPTCQKCGMSLPLTGRVCPYCGEDRPLTPDQAGMGLLFTLLIVGGLILYVQCKKDNKDRGWREEQDVRQREADAKQREADAKQKVRDEEAATLARFRKIRTELKGLAEPEVTSRLSAPVRRVDVPEMTGVWGIAEYPTDPKVWVLFGGPNRTVWGVTDKPPDEREGVTQAVVTMLGGDLSGASQADVAERFGQPTGAVTFSDDGRETTLVWAYRNRIPSLWVSFRENAAGAWRVTRVDWVRTRPLMPVEVP